MIRLIFFAIVSIFLIDACAKKEAKVSENLPASSEKSTQKEDEGLVLFRQTCYACHSVVTKSHDEIIAPPMVAIKRRYLMSYPSEEEFVDAVVAFAKDPKEENALMRGAVQQFKVMPLQTFDENNLRSIATYIYNNDIEKPEWFDAHFEEEHPDGMGMGRGMGQGKGRRNGQ